MPTSASKCSSFGDLLAQAASSSRTSVYPRPRDFPSSRLMFCTRTQHPGSLLLTALSLNVMDKYWDQPLPTVAWRRSTLPMMMLQRKLKFYSPVKKYSPFGGAFFSWVLFDVFFFLRFRFLCTTCKSRLDLA